MGDSHVFLPAYFRSRECFSFCLHRSSPVVARSTSGGVDESRMSCVFSSSWVARCQWQRASTLVASTVILSSMRNGTCPMSDLNAFSWGSTMIVQVNPDSGESCSDRRLQGRASSYTKAGALSFENAQYYFFFFDVDSVAWISDVAYCKDLPSD